jgi:UDP-N-acetylglucosamine 2-epimerase
VGPKTDLSNGYLVVMQHPVTTEYEEARRQVEETLYAVKGFGLPVLWFWPNPDAGSDGTSKGIRVFREKENPSSFHLFRNMFPEDFLRLLVHSTAIVGNSSVAIRECSFLGVPAVNIGSRQQGRERGRNVIDVDHDRTAISNAIGEHVRRGKPPTDHLYGDGGAGKRIADCLSRAELRIEKRLTY